MKKIDMINEMRTQHDYPILRKVKHKLFIPKDAEKLPIKIIRDAFKWYQGLLLHIRELCLIRGYMPEEHWNFYETTGDMEDMREVKLLNESIKNYRKYLRTRPDFFKKTKVKELFHANNN